LTSEINLIKLIMYFSYNKYSDYLFGGKIK